MPSIFPETAAREARNLQVRSILGTEPVAPEILESKEVKPLVKEVHKAVETAAKMAAKSEPAKSDAKAGEDTK
jgi:hypothetical protein